VVIMANLRNRGLVCGGPRNHRENAMEPNRLEQGREPPRNIPSVRKTVITIGVVDEHSFTRECITRSLKGLEQNLDIVSFTSCDDCLQTNIDLDIILYWAHHTIAHNSGDGQQLVPLNNLQEIAPVIILSAVDGPASIVKAFENGARGYIPTASTSLELAIQIIRLVSAGGTFFPPSSLSPRMINGNDATSRMRNTQQFTPRQMAVLNHLKLGKANKVIAYDLGMSESTVKVHIRNIMKKMKATNRTEVACRAQALAASMST
jgi:DNA-binding NarL/FixJ family response regulator